jgi:hypothetical protein
MFLDNRMSIFENYNENGVLTVTTKVVGAAERGRSGLKKPTVLSSS